MSINDLEKEGLRALFKRETDRIDSVIAERMKLLAESQNQHEVFRSNLRADINDPGQLASPNPLFHGYTDIQNLRNWPDKLNYRLPLVVTEKIHGSCSRIGWIRNGDFFEKVIGSHRTQRKLENAGFWGMLFEKYGDNLEAILKRLTIFQEDPNFVKSIIVFGEIYGPGIQDLHYGVIHKEWRAFDIAINGEYIDYYDFIELCIQYDIPTVPELSIGPYTFEELIELAQGDSVLAPGQIKEGIVIKPYIESTWTGAI